MSAICGLWNLFTTAHLFPFGFNCWQSSSPSSEHIYEHRQLLVFRIVNIQITVVTLITSHTNLSTLKLDTHSSLQTSINFTRTLLVFRLVISSMSIWCHWISFDFPWVRGPTHSGNAQSFFSVSIPRTVCAFVSLRHDIIRQQYIDTFLKTVSPNFIQTASFCRFEKFRIKWNPNRAPLDYPLDLTKYTNHKIKTRKWT